MLSAEMINRIVQKAWESIVGESIDKDQQSKLNEDNCTVASIGIQGRTEGMITMECSHKLATMVAQAFYDGFSQEITKELVDDMLGEIVNVIGGQIKSYLPGPCTLSLPKVTPMLPEKKESAYTVQNEALFSYKGEAVRLTLIENIGPVSSPT